MKNKIYILSLLWTSLLAFFSCEEDLTHIAALPFVFYKRY
jgi:hypothetical protein